MTQSYNLSQLANNLTSAGLLDAADGLVNAVPIANGGTGASTASAARTNLVVPSTTGTGASGTWGISVTGNAAGLSSTLAVASGGTGVITSTGSGSNVLSASPTLTGLPLAPTASSATNTTQLATTAFSYGSLSATANGYTILPNGLIFQWGKQTGQSGTITFPIAFPTACLNVVAGLYESTNYCTYPMAITTTYFTYGSNGPGGWAGIRWFAIGI